MPAIDVDKTRADLLKAYPGSKVKGDEREMVAEISGKYAVAVIDRSPMHFHLKTREVYKVLRGTLLVACGGQGYALREHQTIAIEPGQIHFARAAGEPVWVEVESVPDWSVEDYFVL